MLSPFQNDRNSRTTSPSARAALAHSVLPLGTKQLSHLVRLSPYSSHQCEHKKSHAFIARRRSASLKHTLLTRVGALLHRALRRFAVYCSTLCLPRAAHIVRGSQLGGARSRVVAPCSAQSCTCCSQLACDTRAYFWSRTHVRTSTCSHATHEDISVKGILVLTSL